MDKTPRHHDKTATPRRVDPLLMMTAGLAVFFLAILAIMIIA